MMIDFKQEVDPPRPEGGDHPTDQWANGGRDGHRCAHERVHLGAGGTFEIAVNQRLHRREKWGHLPSPPMTAQKTTTATTLCANVIANAPTA